MPHYTPNSLLVNPVDIVVIGAGGNGSLMLTGLARLNHAITALGHPGLNVIVSDPDVVSEANMGRQMFSPADVGQYKATVLVHRINAFFGLRWQAEAKLFGQSHHTYDMAICCVDSAKARAGLAKVFKNEKPRYILDLGNRAADGQVVLGEWDSESHVDQTQADHTALPAPYSLLPELIDTTVPEDDTPSCGLAEALERQELFINQAIVTPALAILWEFFRHGRLTWHGAFINLRNGNMRSLLVPDLAATETA